jgi:hypothetical protein
VDVDIDEYLAITLEDGEVNSVWSNTSTPPEVLNWIVGLILGCLGGCCIKSLWNCVHESCSRELPKTVYEVVSSKDGIVKPNTENFRDSEKGDTLYGDELGE